MNQIKVEFYGIVRQQAGVSHAVVEFHSQVTSLREVLGKLTAQFPKLDGQCIHNGLLLAGFSANLAGEHFVIDPNIQVPCGSSLLLMSSDAGG